MFVPMGLLYSEKTHCCVYLLPCSDLYLYNGEAIFLAGAKVS